MTSQETKDITRPVLDQQHAVTTDYDVHASWRFHKISKLLFDSQLLKSLSWTECSSSSRVRRIQSVSYSRNLQCHRHIRALSCKWKCCQPLCSEKLQLTLQHPVSTNDGIVHCIRHRAFTMYQNCSLLCPVPQIIVIGNTCLVLQFDSVQSLSYSTNL